MQWLFQWWNYDAAVGLLKREGWHVLIFSRFIIFTFRNDPLQNCVMHLKKKIIFCRQNLMKKVHFKLSESEPENIP